MGGPRLWASGQAAQVNPWGAWPTPGLPHCPSWQVQAWLDCVLCICSLSASLRQVDSQSRVSGDHGTEN